MIGPIIFEARNTSRGVLLIPVRKVSGDIWFMILVMYGKALGGKC